MLDNAGIALEGVTRGSTQQLVRQTDGVLLIARVPCDCLPFEERTSPRTTRLAIFGGGGGAESLMQADMVKEGAVVSMSESTEARWQALRRCRYASVNDTPARSVRAGGAAVTVRC